MKKYTVYAECPAEIYFQSLRHLEGEGKIELNIIDSRSFYLLYLMFKSGNRSGILKSLFAPFKLLFQKSIILIAAPYGGRIYYMLLLKWLRKNLYYFTSWPYWNEDKWVKRSWFLNKFLWKKFLKNTKCICINGGAKKTLKDHSKFRYLIPHSVDTSLFKPSKKDNGIRVLYVGRIEEEKGIRGLLEAATRFNDVEFLFVGDGSLAKEIKWKNVKHISYVKDRIKLAEIYGSCDIFVLNSYATERWEEFFGISLIEAMSYGLAVIATDCIGPKEIIQDGKDGFLIKQKDNDALFEKLKLLIDDKGLRNKLGKNAREKAVREYDIRVVAKKWEKVLGI